MAEASTQPVLQDCHDRRSHNALQVLQQGLFSECLVRVPERELDCSFVLWLQHGTLCDFNFQLGLSLSLSRI